MAKKKILLFIVEGPTEESALSTVFSRIFSSDAVRFHVIHGDILTRDFVRPERIAATVNEQIKAFRNDIYKPADFCKVVHLIDMDGAYIPDSSVIEEDAPDKTYPFYTGTQILTPSPRAIIDRNKRKRDAIAKLSATGNIGGIPYSLYYFSCNLDHVLHDRNNLSDTEKIQLSRDFDLQYAGDPNTFIQFMKTGAFAVPGTYSETWAFIKQTGLYSLERHSNLHLELPDHCEWPLSNGRKTAKNG